MAKKLKKYSDFSTVTQKFMAAVEEHLTQKFGGIETQWEGLLNIMATNFQLFMDCREKIHEEGLLVKNRFGGWDKNPLLKVQTDAQIQLVKLVGEFGISPKSIKNLQTVNAEDDFINELIS